MAEAYTQLDGIQNGSEAMNAFATLPKLDDEQRARVRESLLRYCELDTLAMVEILKKLREI